jgi:CheY-like chemotaxis protein
MENRLAHKGHHVTAVDTGHKALALLQQNPQAFDLLVTDYSMPAFDGMMLVQAVLPLRPTLPIFICSGLDLDITQLPPTVRNFRKPLNFDRFFEALNQVRGG